VPAHLPPAERAQNLLTELGIRKVPVPVEEIAARRGAKLAYSEFQGDISGMLLREDDQIIIGVNTRHAQTRQRFTIAHEIGHLEMHKGQPIYVDRFVRVNLRAGGQTSPEEREANAFAAGLLMPEDRVREEFAATESATPDQDTLELVAGLAARFNVSPAAMQYRLAELGSLDPYSFAF
jgi:Zn-dependent peptidase ImmA (M78 family)